MTNQSAPRFDNGSVIAKELMNQPYSLVQVIQILEDQVMRAGNLRAQITGLHNRIYGEKIDDVPYPEPLTPPSCAMSKIMRLLWALEEEHRGIQRACHRLETLA